MLKKENLVNEEEVKMPTPITYDENTAIQMIQENTDKIIEKYKSIKNINNEMNSLSLKMSKIASSWKERLSLKKEDSDLSNEYHKLKDEMGSLGILLKDEKMYYNFYQRNNEYFVACYIHEIVADVLKKYNNKRVGEKTAQKIENEINDALLNSDLGKLVENRYGCQLITWNYFYKNDVFGDRTLDISIELLQEMRSRLRYSVSFHVFDDKNEKINIENKTFNDDCKSERMYNPDDIHDIVIITKRKYKRIKELLDEFNEQRKEFNNITYDVCESIESPKPLYDSIDLDNSFDVNYL